ncbi:MAG TPA: aldo/keto reductase, partial [Lacipirellulaceae bacterium]|nr:aldo/keto reductase [Lacipirellulaceae bacterium]
NLYEALPRSTKLAISREWLAHVPAPIALDSAGKYGAGLALETIGACLRELGVAPEDVIISNKLGWLRTPLKTAEPTFEPGVWAGLEHDAQQRISYAGILACWEQGCELLGAAYRPKLASVHDPDEYLASAATADDRRRRFGEILEAYRALADLKQRGEILAVGVGSKDWRVIREIDAAVPLDWVMLANSLTIYSHPPALLEFLAALAARGVGVINSAVFHAGFLIGGRYFDYRIVDRDNRADQPLFAWRETFHGLCRVHNVAPAVACVQFALSPPGVAAVAMNTSNPAHVGQNAAAVQTAAPAEFWSAAKGAGLISADYPYL